MKKRWLIGCGVAGIVGIGLLAALGLLVVGGAFALTRPVVEASEQFLDMLGQGKISEAYTRAAAGFRARQDVASFTRAVQQLGLTDYASVSWHNRQIDNAEGITEGTITTKGGGTMPVSLHLVWEAGRWAVVDVRYGGIDLVTAQAAPSVPAEAELERMVAQALLDFNQSVQARNFTTFYGTLADVWKKQTTPQGLQTVFQEFIDKKIDIEPIKVLKPRLATSPSVTEQGVLMIVGHYPTQPCQVRFKLQYAREHGAWKLIGINLNVEKEGSAQV